MGQAQLSKHGALFGLVGLHPNEDIVEHLDGH
jgi:hypothetical protein